MPAPSVDASTVDSIFNGLDGLSSSIGAAGPYVVVGLILVIVVATCYVVYNKYVAPIREKRLQLEFEAKKLLSNQLTAKIKPVTGAQIKSETKTATDPMAVDIFNNLRSEFDEHKRNFSGLELMVNGIQSQLADVVENKELSDLKDLVEELERKFQEISRLCMERGQKVGKLLGTVQQVCQRVTEFHQELQKLETRLFDMMRDLIGGRV